jgi:hypothetical protein
MTDIFVVHLSQIYNDAEAGHRKAGLPSRNEWKVLLNLARLGFVLPVRFIIRIVTFDPWSLDVSDPRLELHGSTTALLGNVKH